MVVVDGMLADEAGADARRAGAAEDMEGPTDEREARGNDARRGSAGGAGAGGAEGEGAAARGTPAGDEGFGDLEGLYTPLKVLGEGTYAVRATRRARARPWTAGAADSSRVASPSPGGAWDRWCGRRCGTRTAAWWR